MRNKEFIIILDHDSGIVYTTEYNSQEFDSFKEFLYDFNTVYDLSLLENSCDWMITKDELLIKNL